MLATFIRILSVKDVCGVLDFSWGQESVACMFLLICRLNRKVRNLNKSVFQGKESLLPAFMLS